MVSTPASVFYRCIVNSGEKKLLLLFRSCIILVYTEETPFLSRDVMLASAEKTFAYAVPSLMKHD